MKAYKGFEKDGTCRGFKYEEGKSYVEEKAVLCQSGFHACLDPLDCFQYYSPGTSVYREVELTEDIDESDEDTKVVGKKITIGELIRTVDICEIHAEYVKSKCTFGKSAGDGSYLSAGDSSSLSAGDGSSLSAGDSSSLSAGDSSYLSAGTGSYLSAGTGSSLSAGDRSIAASRWSSSVGENGIAVARGNGCKVRGGIGSILVIAEESSTSYDIFCWKAVFVDGEIVKADTWYTLEEGEFVESV